MSHARVIEVLPANRVIEIVEDDGTRVVEVPGRVVEVVEVGRLVVTVVGASSYTHTQAAALARWTIAHNLGRRPMVAVRSVGGVDVAVPEVTHPSTDVCLLDFDVPFAGEAYLI